MNLQMRSQKLLSAKLEYPFCISPCNLLICQIFTHEWFCCPLWATVGKLWLNSPFQCILREKKKDRFWSENNSLKRKHENKANSRGKYSIKTKNKTKQETIKAQKWSRRRKTAASFFICCLTIFKILNICNKKHLLGICSYFRHVKSAPINPTASVYLQCLSALSTVTCVSFTYLHPSANSLMA